MNYVPTKIYVQIPAPIIMGWRVRLWDKVSLQPKLEELFANYICVNTRE